MATTINTIKCKDRGPCVMRLLVKIENKDFIIGSLSFNISMNQLYYLLERPIESKDIQLNLNTNQLTTPIEKISFHTDKTHIKIKDMSNDKPRDFKLDVTIKDLLPKDNSVKIVMVESFYIESNCAILPTPINNKNPFRVDAEQLIASLATARNFSLILILVPTTFKTEDLLCRPILIENIYILLADFIRDGQPVGRIAAFRDYDLMVFITPYAPKLITKQKIPTGPIRAINYKAPIQSLIKIYIENFGQHWFDIKTAIINLPEVS